MFHVKHLPRAHPATGALDLSGWVQLQDIVALRS